MSVVRALPLERLRERTSEKWREYPPDVLPMFVAETDFEMAPTVRAALDRALAAGDTGYIASRTPLPAAFAGFAQRRYGWSPDPARMRSTADVSMGIVEILRHVTAPDDRVIVMPPVYPPFYELVAEAGAVVERVPLTASDAGWEIDLAGVEHALRGGARAVLLCNPHNPTGTVHPSSTLAHLAELAAEYGAAVVSDEIHAPMTQSDRDFTPFLATGAAAHEVGYAVVSASKAFNLAGLKCALMVAASEATWRVLRSMPIEVEWRTGQFGLIAATAAFGEESGEWLDSLVHTLDGNRRHLADRLPEVMPGSRYRMPDAGYLAWIDLRELGWGDRPAKRILQEARVALQPGAPFGTEGRGWVRLNFGTSREIIDEALDRISALTAG